MAAPRFACPIVRVRIFEGRGSAPHGCLRSHGSPRCRLLMILLLAVTTESTSLALTLNNQTSSKYYITLQLNTFFFIMLSVLQNVFSAHSAILPLVSFPVLRGWADNALLLAAPRSKPFLRPCYQCRVVRACAH